MRDPVRGMLPLFHHWFPNMIGNDIVSLYCAKESLFLQIGCDPWILNIHLVSACIVEKDGFQTYLVRDSNHEVVVVQITRDENHCISRFKWSVIFIKKCICLIHSWIRSRSFLIKIVYESNRVIVCVVQCLTRVIKFVGLNRAKSDKIFFFQCLITRGCCMNSINQPFLRCNTSLKRTFTYFHVGIQWIHSAPV